MISLASCSARRRDKSRLYKTTAQQNRVETRFIASPIPDVARVKYISINYIISLFFEFCHFGQSSL